MLRRVLLTLLSAAALAGASATRPPDTTITYAHVDTIDLKLDLYLPARDSLSHPLIVWIHGGGWRGGSRADASPALAWLDSGYAVASIDYRLSQQAQWPAQIHDAKASVRWLRANAAAFALDTSRIIAWGASAGAHLAAMLGVADRLDGLDGVVGGNLEAGSRVQAVIDYYGATNFLEPIPKRWTPWSSVGQLLGCAVPKCPDRARGASPLEYVSPGDAPFLIVHGSADTTVPISQSVQLEAALRAAQVPVRFVTVAAGHGGPAFTAIDARMEVRGFFAGLPAGSPAAARGTEVAGASLGPNLSAPTPPTLSR